jgi:alginate O-acetyltransferase complex protein AlgI
LLTGWLGMLGVVLLLHFGLFHVLALFWRGNGRNVVPLMRAPLLATSLADFWGNRWNTAFNALAHNLAFRPLVRRIGVGWATLGVFLISGLIHDLVISLPARGGYGLPTAYFLVQGMGVLFERSRTGRAFGLGRGGRGWLFTFIVTAAPAFWLFHPSFIRIVILPMLHAIGAIWNPP